MPAPILHSLHYSSICTCVCWKEKIDSVKLVHHLQHTHTHIYKNRRSQCFQLKISTYYVIPRPTCFPKAVHCSSAIPLSPSPSASSRPSHIRRPWTVGMDRWFVVLMHDAQGGFHRYSYIYEHNEIIWLWTSLHVTAWIMQTQTAGYFNPYTHYILAWGEDDVAWGWDTTLSQGTIQSFIYSFTPSLFHQLGEKTEEPRDNPQRHDKNL